MWHPGPLMFPEQFRKFLCWVRDNKRWLWKAVAYLGSCDLHIVGSCQCKIFSPHLKGKKRWFNLKPFEWPCLWNTNLGYPKLHAPKWKQFHGFTKQRMPLVKAILKCIGGYSIGHVLWWGDILKASLSIVTNCLIHHRLMQAMTVSEW